MWGADLAAMQLVSKFSKWFRFWLCVIDIYCKYAWIVPLKDEKVLQLLILFKAQSAIKLQQINDIMVRK